MTESNFIKKMLPRLSPVRLSDVNEKKGRNMHYTKNKIKSMSIARITASAHMYNTYVPVTAS
jgi:hypothetical protein